MVVRSTSEPPHGKLVPESGSIGNVFYSEGNQAEYRLQAARPKGLPELSPGDAAPIHDGQGQRAGECIGKGRGGSASSKPAVFVTPPSRKSGMDGDGVEHTVKQSEGQMPDEFEATVKSMGRVTDNRVPETVDELQRALEVEVVNQLREQNTLLMAELEELRRLHRSSPNSGLDSVSSWVEVPSEGVRERKGSSGGGEVGGCKTPRAGVTFGNVSKFTPNGTKIPDGTPPQELSPEIPMPPPMPPFPMEVQEDTATMLERYDISQLDLKVRSVDPQWKPACEKSHEPTPGEARAFWLEKEVASLRSTLANMVQGNSFHGSEYWNGRFQRSVDRPQSNHGSGHPALPSNVGQVDPDLAERISRAYPGDLPRGANLHGDRASTLSNGGLGDECRHDRASAMDGARHGVCPGNLLGGFDVPPHGRALHDSEVCHQGRAVHGEGLHQVRAQQGGHVSHQDRVLHGDGVYQHDRALHGPASNPLDKVPGNPWALPRHGLGGGGSGDGCQDRIYGPWSGSEQGSMNTKAELPDLPATSSPLQFGDWLHLCTPSMKDISGVAGWWWESTLREAKVYYEQWKSSSPLQRIQIRPRLPDDLNEHRFQRTEQRGVQMLLKAIPLAEQQELVTDRSLSSTAILYKLMVRFQPGGAGEKQILLQQLTTMPKVTNAHDVASALRNWRRHFGRAQEVQAVLPDGVLLVKALDEPLQKIANLDQQAAFRLSQSRMQLQLDEKPEHGSLWAFSQCLLAEAETLCLMATTPKTEQQSSLKLKPMDATGLSSSIKSSSDSTSTTNGKGKGGATFDAPCKWFRSDQGCRAGSKCKWSHSWEGVSDKGARCFVCGSKEHRKADCKVRGGGGGKKDEPKGSGGGSANSNSLATATPSTKATASTTTSSPMASPSKPMINEITTTSTANASTGELKTGNPGNDGGEMAKGLGDGGTGGDQAARNEKTAELLHEATQLLRTLKGPHSNPTLKVMQLEGLNRVENDMVLIDSGATHALRPAMDLAEWNQAEKTTVQLADGTTSSFRLKCNTKILLGHPSESTAKILPMSALNDLDFVLEWRDGHCHLQDCEGRVIPVALQNGCPMLEVAQGDQLLQWLEAFQTHQRRKLAIVKTMMTDADQVDKNVMDLELALTLRLREQFPQLPDEIMAKVVPHLEMTQTINFASQLPWNRRKRRRLMQAKHIIIHCFSGPDQAYWDKHCGDNKTEVLCIDTTCSTPANLHNKNIYGFLLMLCASGRVRSIIGGPPCRTISALRYQGDEGPGILRTEDHPYGLPTLNPSDLELVVGDTILMFRFWSLMILAEEVRELELPPTMFVMEQPEDPARYRSAEDVEANKYFSVFRTVEWSEMAKKFGLRQVHCDQHPMGHQKRKPTTLGTNDAALDQLQGLRGAPSDESEAAARYRSLTMQQRCQESKSWACWAPGLKAAIAEAINQHVKQVDCILSPLHQLRAHEPPSASSSRSPSAGRPDSVQPPMRADAASSDSSEHPLQPGQHPMRMKALGSVALEQWRRHFLNDHLPARR